MISKLSIAFAAICLFVSNVEASSLAVSASGTDLDCDIFIPAYTPFTFYVLALPYFDEAGQCGMRSADFRVTGLPTNWFYLPPVVNPNASMVGDPLGAGATVTFPMCQGGPVVYLTMISGFAISQIPQQLVDVVARSDMPQTCQDPQRPSLTACTAPDPTALCVQHSPLFINPYTYCGPLKPEDNGRSVARSTCEVAVEGTTWGVVKRLYQD